MNEAQTRAELIDPMLNAAGWGVVEDSKILREVRITEGKIQTGGYRTKPLIADYILVYKNRKLAVIEAKSDEADVNEGVAQAKNYAEKLHIDHAYSCNGNAVYQINMNTGKEGLLNKFPSPDELLNEIIDKQNEWIEKFNNIPFEDISGTKLLRFYQEIAVNKALSAIAKEKNRILLILATGTGKTFIAFQIVWKLFYSRWNLKRDGSRRPRILFLADRNILANQAFNNFNAFPEDALVRIRPGEIRKQGRVPVNGSIFFTIFQTFMSGENNTPYFGQYPNDYFDLIIIDECHRGGANNEGNWHAIVEYFSPAVQLGLTATPKRTDNIDTYRYFGEPVYVYSLKEGINDGFLTPFKVKKIQTTLDEYIYTSDDTIIEGEVEQGRIYKEADFNRIIKIKERERKRVKILLENINQKEKTIIFCANQEHALAVRDLVNQHKDSDDPNYCQRVTANDGELGEQFLRDFQDNEKTIPAILTTSQKLSTGVDARNIRNIVLLRPVNSMIEFKQIIGRGTRLFEGKEFFTIYDYVNAYHHFSDPEWDGEPEEPVITEKDSTLSAREEKTPYNKLDNSDKPKKLIIKLRDGKEREIQYMLSTSFWSADGRPISAEEFLQNLFGHLPEYFKDENELREIWSNPAARKVFLERLGEAGYGKEELAALQQLVNAENSDLFDVLEYVAYAVQPVTREARVAMSQSMIFKNLNSKQKEFIEFILSQYIHSGVDELSQEKLPGLMELKYQSIADAPEELGGVDKIKNLFISFQKYLYAKTIFSE